MKSGKVHVHKPRDIRMFDNDVAKRFGLSEAVFIMHLQQKIGIDLQMQQSGMSDIELVVKDGLVWRPWTLEQLSLEMPFWTSQQVRRVKDSCIKQGIVKTDCFNQNLMDRRLWYAVVE